MPSPYHRHPPAFFLKAGHLVRFPIRQDARQHMLYADS